MDRLISSHQIFSDITKYFDHVITMEKKTNALRQAECMKLDCQQIILSQLDVLTCYGYDINDLLEFGRACREAGITDKELKAFAERSNE